MKGRFLKVLAVLTAIFIICALYTHFRTKYYENAGVRWAISLRTKNISRSYPRFDMGSYTVFQPRMELGMPYGERDTHYYEYDSKRVRLSAFESCLVRDITGLAFKRDDRYETVSRGDFLYIGNKKGTYRRNISRAGNICWSFLVDISVLHLIFDRLGFKYLYSVILLVIAAAVSRYFDGCGYGAKKKKELLLGKVRPYTAAAKYAFAALAAAWPIGVVILHFFGEAQYYYAYFPNEDKFFAAFFIYGAAVWIFTFGKHFNARKRAFAAFLIPCLITAAIFGPCYEFFTSNVPLYPLSDASILMQGVVLISLLLLPVWFFHYLICRVYTANVYKRICHSFFMALYTSGMFAFCMTVHIAAEKIVLWRAG